MSSPVSPSRLTTVFNDMIAPDRTAIGNKKVSIQLNVPAFADAGASEVMRTAYAPTDPNTGVWTATLLVNADLDPPGTYYTSRELSGVIWTFVVPYSPTPISLRSCLVTDPANTTPIDTGVSQGQATTMISQAIAALNLGSASTHAATDFVAAPLPSGVITVSY